jgi:hypothetical protein
MCTCLEAEQRCNQAWRRFMRIMYVPATRHIMHVLMAPGHTGWCRPTLRKPHPCQLSQPILRHGLPRPDRLLTSMRCQGEGNTQPHPCAAHSNPCRHRSGARSAAASARAEGGAGRVGVLGSVTRHYTDGYRGCCIGAFEHGSAYAGQTCAPLRIARFALWPCVAACEHCHDS